MSARKEIGHIKSCYFGMGGYQGQQLGVWFELGGKSWSTFAGDGAWSSPPDRHAKWTIEDQSTAFAKTMRYVAELLKDARVDDFAKLRNVPIEATFDGMILSSWRILTEVIPDD